MINSKITNENIIAVYSNGEIELNISISEETIWLNANDIAALFDVQRPAIVKHIGNMYKTDELSKDATCSILEQVAQDGKKRKLNFYNLDMIISVGYRVNSIKATKFRQWATRVLKQYISNGYTINSEKITHQRFTELEKDVDNLKHKINTIDNFHDRFLILDKNEAYHVGASLKDLGKKVFGFSKIDIKLLMDGINE